MSLNWDQANSTLTVDGNSVVLSGTTPKAFSTFRHTVTGQNIISDQSQDVLKFTPGDGIQLNFNQSTDTITFEMDPAFRFGFTGSTGFTGSQGAQGIDGAYAALGYTGSQGDIGFSGSSGAFGFTGSQGPKGFTGSSGFSGSQGVIGDQGIQGDTGFTGSQGIQGFTGSFGATGATGSTGTQGNVGFTGSKGFAGSTGPSGPQGNLGPTGFTGSTGLSGAIGYAGSKGNVGFSGSIGVGYTGSKGDKGYTGSQGAQGTPGEAANIGYTGSKGIAGPTGFTGSSGPLGPEGLPGPEGFTGSRGQDGIDGAYAALGYTGSQGDQGPLGFTGSQGAGFTGSQGDQGPLGFTGSQGDGFTGSQGLTGSQGAQGAQGVQGIQGFTGSAGASSNLQQVTNLGNVTTNGIEVESLIVGSDLIVGLGSGGGAVSGLALPVNPTDAASKEYVDANSGGLDTAAVQALIDAEVQDPTTLVLGTSCTGGIQIGKDTSASTLSGGGIALGQNADASGNQAIAVGIGAVGENSAVAIGIGAQTSTNSVSIGRYASSPVNSGVAVGNSAFAFGTGTAVGKGAKAGDTVGGTGLYSVALGADSFAQYNHSMHINSSYNTGTGPSAIGGIVLESSLGRMEYIANSDWVFNAPVKSSEFKFADGTSMTTASTGGSYGNVEVQEYLESLTSVFIGYNTSTLNPSENHVIIGDGAKVVNSGVGIGENAYCYQQGVAIGRESLSGWNGHRAIAIGELAGSKNLGPDSVALGYKAGGGNWRSAAYPSIRHHTTHIGSEAGSDDPGVGTTALGYQAGKSDSGNYSVSVGYKAGQVTQGTNSIIISSLGSPVNNSTSGSITIKSNAVGGSLEYEPSSNVWLFNAPVKSSEFKFADGTSMTTASTGGIGSLAADLTPQLGGDLDVNGKDIVTTSGADIDLNPDTTGEVVFRGNATRGSGSFKLNCENNTHGVTIKGPAHSAAADYTLTLPTTDGDTNQVLTTDGSGVLSWSTPAGGSGGGSGLYAMESSSAGGTGVGDPNLKAWIGCPASSTAVDKVWVMKHNIDDGRVYAIASYTTAAGLADSIRQAGFGGGPGDTYSFFSNQINHLTSCAAHGGSYFPTLLQSAETYASVDDIPPVGFDSEGYLQYLGSEFVLNGVSMGSGITSQPTAGDQGIGIGDGAYAAQQSIAIGLNADASAAFATAIGKDSSATGNFGMAIGENTKASTYSVALGYNADASQNYTTAIGWSSVATGPASSALGHECEATGAASFAIGSDSTATASQSLAMGYKTNVTSPYGLALGSRQDLAGSALYTVAVGNNLNTQTYTYPNAIFIHAGEENSSRVSKIEVREELVEIQAGGSLGINTDASLKWEAANSWVFGSSVTAPGYTVGGTGSGTISSTDRITLNGANGVINQTGTFRLANMDTSTRNGFSASNGDMIYNTTDGRIQAYQAGTWINLDDGTVA